MTSPVARPRRSSRAFVQFFAMALALTLLAGAPVWAGVTIHCIDVGEADATLIVSTSGKTLLFDAGDTGDGNNIIVPYLNSLGIGALDYVACSHYHADHIGGLDEVVNNKGVTYAAYDRGWSYTTQAYTQYVTAVGAKRTTLTDLQVIDLGDGVTATIVSINSNGVDASPYTSTSSKDENDFSVALHVEAGDFDFFVGGDLSGVNNSPYHDIETSVAPRVGKLEVLRVNHHGSQYSTNATFANTLHPEVAVISVSTGYGHPTQTVLNRLAGIGAHIYQTELGDGGTLPPEQDTVVHGHIVISTVGHGTYTVNGTTYAMNEPDLTAVPVTPDFAVLGNWPNPFNPATNIWFETRGGGQVLLTIYDLAGRRLLERTVETSPGQQSIRWDGTDKGGQALPTGVYFYRLQSSEGAGSGKLSLVR
jgi:competence protein ComEC